MAALLGETLIDFGAVARLIPGRSGKRLSPTTCWRWASRGVLAPDGRRVHLESIRCGGRTLTSVEAVGRFVAALTPRVEGSTPPLRSPAERKRASDKAEAELQKMGA